MLLSAKLQTVDFKLISNRSFKKMIKRRDPNMEVLFFGLEWKGNFFVLDYHNLYHDRVF